MSADSSEWKKSGVKRRDTRNTKIPEEILKYKPRKKTRKWCRGKTGVAHKPKCTDDRIGKLLICERCGKHLERWLGSSSWLSFGITSKQPDWVK